MKIPFDKIIERVAALGVPGLVLVVAVYLVGATGGAAIVLALSTLGGPLGMMGGIALLGLLVLVSQALTEYGFEKVFVAVLRGLKKKGLSKKDVLEKIASYPISLSLQLKLKAYVDAFWDL